MSYAHSQGVVHRDIKPSNILICKNDKGEETYKILDFGIAKNIRPGKLESMCLTNTGEVFGSPLYMSPEQCLAKPIDERSDIYSLGCVLYECAAGLPAFMSESVSAALIKHINGEPAPLPKEIRSSPLAKTILLCLEREPVERYQTMSALLDSLASLADCSVDQGRLDATSFLATDRLNARIKASLIDALIIATIAGIIFLLQVGYVFFQDMAAPTACFSTSAANPRADWTYGREGSINSSTCMSVLFTY